MDISLKKLLSLLITLGLCLTLIGNIVLATDTGNNNNNNNGEEDPNDYDITLTQNYNQGDQKVTLEWTGVTDDTTLSQVAKVGDYVDYPISQDKIYSNYESLNRQVKNKTEIKSEDTMWRVIYNDGETVKLVSTGTLVNTTISGEDYNWRRANPYSYGDEWGDGGGYGLYYQIDQIAKCFADYSYVTNVRALNITDLPRRDALINLMNFLKQTETDDISIEMREEGYEEIYDTDKHGGFFGIGGKRNYDAKVATITDTSGLYTGGKFFLPNYFNGTDFLRAAYYVDGTDVKIHRTYKKGSSITAGIKAVVTLKAEIFKTSGNGSRENPWKISTSQGHGRYTVYQKEENEKEYTEKEVTGENSTVLGIGDGVLDLIGPDKPNAELGLIRGDGWNLTLNANAGDRGTSYYHKIIGTAGFKQFESNETYTTITTGVAGFSYVIDQNEETDPGSEIKFIPGEEIIVPRVQINTGYYLHLKAIDYAGNESEILHMPLTFVFRDLNLFKTYQELSDVNDVGIAGTPGWNYVNIDWNPIEIEKDDPSELPEVILTIDVSGSMNRDGSGHWNESNRNNRINLVKRGATTLVNKLIEYYPNMKVGIVSFSDGSRVLANPTNDLNVLTKAINNLYAVGGTDADSGIRRTTDILLQSTQKNRVLIVMTDGYPDSASATRSALQRATSNGINVISLLIDAYSEANSIYVPYSTTSYWVNNSTSELYDKIAYDLYQAILDTMIAKYYPYREAEGEINFTQVSDEAIIEVEYADNTATDKAGPARPIVTLTETGDRDGTIKMDLWGEDRGTAYEFYVKFVHPRTKDELYSNPVVQEIKTGIKGYAWSVTNESNSDPGSTIRDLQFTFGPEDVGKWLHIRGIDYAGNLGEICHVRIETSRYISWEELNDREELFCVQHGQTIPARVDENHLNATVIAGSGIYAIKETVVDPKTGDRIGTRFVEGTTTNIYGTQDIYSYSLGKYVISPDTPPTRPGKEGNATEKEAYILNFYAQNGSLESFVQKAMYSAEISKGNITWNWEETPESIALLAEANAYAAYKRNGYEFSNIKLDTAVYMDDNYEDVLIGPFILKYEPQGVKVGEKELYFAGIIGMKLYNQNNEVIAELDKNGANIGSIDVEFVYTGTATASKREEELFTREKYKFPVGYEEFYIKLKYNDQLENVTNINKVEFIHNELTMDAQYNVLDGTYNKVKWTPNRITSKDKDVLWCYDVENGLGTCKHDKTYTHIVGCYFYLTATVYNSYRNIPSQKIIDVLWAKSNYETRIQTIEPGTGEVDPEYPGSDEYTNNEWRLVMDFSGNVWHDGMEDQNNGIKENVEQGIEKVRVNIYQVDKNANRTGTSYYTYTDNVGNYLIEDAKKGIYDLEFVYNGQIYKSTKLLVNGSAVDYKNDLTHQKYKNNSVAEETSAARQELNNAFEEIAGNSTAIGGRGSIDLTYDVDINTSKIQTSTEEGYTKPEFEIAAITSTHNIYYPISKRMDIENQKYIKIVDNKNVNLGLAERYKTDTSLRTDLYEATFSIKGDKQSYIFSEKDIRNINSNIERDEYVQEINRADYLWTLEELLSHAPDQETIDRLLEILGSKEQSELEAYLDYMIVIRNAGEKDEVQIAELANYFSKDLEYAEQYRDFDITSWAQVKYDEVSEGSPRNKTDKIEITWSANSKYDNASNPYSDEYNKIYTTGLDREDLRVQKGEYLEVHIIFKVTKDETGKIELDENDAGKVSMTEINGYKTYYISDGSIAGLIDSDSQPGNANPKETREYEEDDEEKAPSLKLRLAESANNGDSMDGENEDDINRDENGNIIGYGNVLEGNVWEDLKTENVQKLINNQIISDGIRQDDEPLVQGIQVDLIEYFKHPTDPSRDVYLKLKTQQTRAVLSLSNGQMLEGGYSFINLASGNYKINYTYGTNEQLQQNLKYNGQDYQGISTGDIYDKEGTETTYEHVEIMIVVDVSGSMNGNIDNIKSTATDIANGIYSELPEVKIGLTKFNDVAEVLVNPSNNQNRLQTQINNLGSNNETAIGYGLEAATNSYSDDAKQKIMIVLTDSDETVQNIEQVIKQLEIATDDNQIELTTILTKDNDEIFGTEEEPRRGTVYKLYDVDIAEVINSICQDIIDESTIENRRSSAKDMEGDINTPGTRAYSINKYQVMTLNKATKIDVENIDKLTGEERQKAVETLANETYMMAESKMTKFKANNVSISDIHELNLALMERPKTKLVIETQIMTLKVVLADGTVIIDTEKGLSKNVLGLDQENVPISIYMDEEIMHGANLIVKYEIKIRNEGEIDTLANYLTGAALDTVTTRAKLVFNYTSKNMLYRDENNTWDVVDISDIKESVTGETIEVLKDKDMKTYQTEGFGIELYPEGSKEVEENRGYSEAVFTVTLSKLITGENNESDLTFDSSMEIVERENTAGRRSETEVPGNYVADTVPIELDAVKNRKIIITKPWGEDRSMTYVIIGIAACTVLAGGIIIIKKRKQK